MRNIYLQQDPKTGYWNMFEAPGKSEPSILQTHSRAQCKGREEYGCAIHNDPSEHPLMDAPLLWRTDRNILERVCIHGVGHPDYDSAKYLEEQGQESENVHGCDGCCAVPQAEEFHWSLGRTHHCDECRPDGKDIELVLRFDSEKEWTLYIDNDDCYVQYTYVTDHTKGFNGVMWFFTHVQSAKYPEFNSDLADEVTRIIRSRQEEGVW